MTKKIIAAIFISLLIGGLYLAFGSGRMSSEELAFRTYVASVHLEAQVSECKAKLPSWQSDYPDAMNSWRKRNEKLIRRGGNSYQAMMTKAAAEDPRTVTVDQALARIRKEALDEIPSVDSSYFVPACKHLGEALGFDDLKR